MSDLRDIKIKILEENRVGELLQYMECEHVLPKSNRYEAQLPYKFGSDNKRSVQLYLNEYMSCRIRSKGVSKLDVYGLVSYVVFDIYNENEHTSNIYKSKRWICEKLGYTEFLNYRSTPEKKKDDPLIWLKDVKKKRKKDLHFENFENDTLDEQILEQYINYPYKNYIDEGVDYRTQVEFQIGFDLQSERIVFPIHNEFGDIVSIKGRSINPNYKILNIPKFMAMYGYNKIVEMYNWHRSIDHIVERKEVIIFEGEKSCWMSTQYGFPNCVSISGDDLSDYQIKKIKSLGVDISIIIAMDKDKMVENDKKEIESIKQARKFGKNRRVYVIEDEENLLSLEDKNSPVDLGYAIWQQLYNTKRRVVK